MLDSRRPVTWAKIERIDTPIADVEQYEYRPDVGWRWLQRAAFKVLDWIGAHHMGVVTTFRRTPQENDGLLKSLLGQEGEWIELLHRSGEPLHIYMGPDDHCDLMALVNFREMNPTSFYGRIETCDRRFGGKWHDIPITIVPWMVGAVIVPAAKLLELSLNTKVDGVLVETPVVEAFEIAAHVRSPLAAIVVA